MFVSEVAKQIGKHPDTIRKLEARGLITVRRDVNGHRVFTADVVARIRRLYALDTSDERQAETK